MLLPSLLLRVSMVGMTHLKLGPLNRAADAALTFVLLNTAALVAFAKFVTGRKVVWAGTRQRNDANPLGQSR